MTDEDPTRVEMNTDPLTARMSGGTHYGQTFDVPFVSEIVPGLWQGGCEEGLRLLINIRHVISLYPWEKYEHRGILSSFLEVKMYDSLNQALDQVTEVARWVNVCRRAKGDVLVHCQAGLNRSSLVAARALYIDGYGTGKEIIDLIRSKRSPACLCNPHFEKEVLSWA